MYTVQCNPDNGNQTRGQQLFTCEMVTKHERSFISNWLLSFPQNPDLLPFQQGNVWG